MKIAVFFAPKITRRELFLRDFYYQDLQVLRKLGFKVIVPRIPPLKELKLDHECYDWFAHAYSEILLRNDVDKDKV